MAPGRLATKRRTRSAWLGSVAVLTVIMVLVLERRRKARYQDREERWR